MYRASPNQRSLKFLKTVLKPFLSFQTFFFIFFYHSILCHNITRMKYMNEYCLIGALQGVRLFINVGKYIQDVSNLGLFRMNK